jgi:hypothetical protein
MDQLKIWRCANCVITVLPSASAKDILSVAVPKLHEIEPGIPDGEYCLLFANRKLADTVPPDNQPFTLEGYKVFIGKAYQKLTLYACPVDDYAAGKLHSCIHD